MKNKITNYIKEIEKANSKAIISILGYNFSTQKSFAYNSSLSMESASVFKLFLAYIFLKEKSALLEKTVSLKEVTKASSPGSNLLAYLSPGSKITYHDVLFFMMALSDNTATNFIIDKLGGVGKINKYLSQKLHFAATVLHNKLSKEAILTGSFGSTTPEELQVFFQMLLKEKAFVRKLLFFFLEKEEFQDRLKRYLPIQGQYTSASPISYFGSKGGTFSATGLNNDVGFLVDGKNKMLLVVFTQHIKALHHEKNGHIDHPANLFIAKIGLFLYEYLR